MISGMMAEVRKRDTGVERMKENCSHLKERISQLEEEVTRLQLQHESYTDIGVQTMTDEELKPLPVSEI